MDTALQPIFWGAHLSPKLLIFQQHVVSGVGKKAP